MIKATKVDPLKGRTKVKRRLADDFQSVSSDSKKSKNATEVGETSTGKNLRITKAKSNANSKLANITKTKKVSNNNNAIPSVNFANDNLKSKRSRSRFDLESCFDQFGRVIPIIQTRAMKAKGYKVQDTNQNAQSKPSKISKTLKNRSIQHVESDKNIQHVESGMNENLAGEVQRLTHIDTHTFREFAGANNISNEVDPDGDGVDLSINGSDLEDNFPEVPDDLEPGQISSSDDESEVTMLNQQSDHHPLQPTQTRIASKVV